MYRSLANPSSNPLRQASQTVDLREEQHLQKGPILMLSSRIANSLLDQPRSVKGITLGSVEGDIVILITEHWSMVSGRLE